VRAFCGSGGLRRTARLAAPRGSSVFSQPSARPRRLKLENRPLAPAVGPTVGRGRNSISRQSRPRSIHGVQRRHDTRVDLRIGGSTDIHADRGWLRTPQPAISGRYASRAWGLCTRDVRGCVQSLSLRAKSRLSRDMRSLKWRVVFLREPHRRWAQELEGVDRSARLQLTVRPIRSILSWGFRASRMFTDGRSTSDSGSAWHPFASDIRIRRGMLPFRRGGWLACSRDAA